MNVEIGSEAALFPGKEYIMEISFAVWERCAKYEVGTAGLVLIVFCYGLSGQMITSK
jgi:hypothetical protein